MFSQILVKLTQFVCRINSFNHTDFEKKSENQYERSSHFNLKFCISCLSDKVYVCGRIFVKLTQFVYLINSLNPIDFHKNLTIRIGKVAILSKKFAFLVYMMKSTFFGRIFVKLTQFVYLINSSNPIDFEKQSDYQ